MTFIPHSAPADFPTAGVLVIPKESVMVRPVAANIGVSFPYGVKYKNGTIHKGVDFSNGTEGNPVYAARGGTVIHAGYGGWGPAYGQHVVVRINDGDTKKFTLYGHLKTENVRVGQTVKAGEKIGTNGGKAGQRYSGNSTGPHLHFQLGYQNRYDRYEDPWHVINTAAPDPAKVDVWFTAMFWNLAGFDKVHGKASWDQREAGIVKALKYYDRDVIGIAELPKPKVAGFEARLAKIGYKIAVYDEGRGIICRTTAKVGRTKKVTLDAKGPANDDKQIVLAEITPKGKPRLIFEAGHFEYRDGAAYDKTRVAQAKQTRKATEDFAEMCGLGLDRVVMANDENSQSQVSTAFGTSWPDAKNATTYGNATYSTLCGWSGKASKGTYRPDKIRAHKSRPLVGASTSLTFVDDELSDHLPILLTVARKAA